MNLIYKFTNKDNGKSYVGLTTRSFERRLSEHKYRFTSSERDHKLYKALDKHGWNSFDKEVIFCVLNREDLPEFEELFIREYDSFSNGYNMTCGDALVSDDTRELLRSKMLGREITWLDKIMETKKKRGVYKKGSLNRSSKVYLIQDPDQNEFYIKGLSEFSKSIGVNASNLLKTLGTKKHCRGYRIIARFNDYPEREYTQAGGNAEYPVSQQDKDIVWSA